MNRRSESKYVLESEGTSNKKLAKLEQLRIEYDMNIKALERDLEQVSAIADSLKREKNNQRAILDELETEAQELLEIKEKIKEKVNHLENSIENFNEKLEMIEYSSFLEHSISELPKTPKKIKKVQKSVNKSQVFKSLPSQINFVNKLKEKVELQMKDMQTALEKSQKRVEDRKNLIVFLETYKKNNLGKIIMSEEVNEKVTENDCFVQSIDVSGQSRTVNPGVNKFALKRKKSLKIQRNFFSYISFCSSILCIKIF